MKTISEKEANLLLTQALLKARKLFFEKKYKESAIIYSNIAKNILYWEKNVQVIKPVPKPKPKPKEEEQELEKQQ